MSYAPDGSHVATASADRTIHLWTAPPFSNNPNYAAFGKTIRVLQGHNSVVLSVAHSQDGSRLYSNDERLMRVWDVATGTCLLNLNVEEFTGGLKNVSPGARKTTWTLSCAIPGCEHEYFAVASNNRFVYFLDSTTGQEVFSVFCKAPVYCLSSGYKNIVVFGDSFGNVYVVNLQWVAQGGDRSPANATRSPTAWMLGRGGRID